MDYKKVYDNIIQRRIETPIGETEYGERHHIIPRSLGGTDEPNNLVKLTAREHFICHALLAEMYESESVEWIKMNHAFMMMNASSDNQSRYFNSRLYELKRKDFSKVMSVTNKGKIPWNKGLTKESNETLKSLSKKVKNTFKSKRNGELTSYEKKKVKWERGKQLKKDEYVKKELYFNQLYKEFINSECVSLREFHKKIEYPYVVGALSNSFHKYVKDYSPIHRKSYKS